MKNSLKYLVVVIFALGLATVTAYSQEAYVIEKYEGEKYPETKWGADNKHFAYYQLRYAMQIPIISSDEIENTSLSGNFAVGLIYRYKLIDFWDIGLELGYKNRNSRIKDEFHELFDTVDTYNSISTYYSGINAAVFNRFIFKDSNIRNLGWHADIGAYFNYSFGYGLLKKYSDDYVDITVREKKPDYLDPLDYGVVFRFGKDYLAFYLKYSLTDWIIDLDGENYTRTPLSVGIQFNLYAR